MVRYIYIYTLRYAAASPGTYQGECRTHHLPTLTSTEHRLHASMYAVNICRNRESWTLNIGTIVGEMIDRPRLHILAALLALLGGAKVYHTAEPSLCPADIVENESRIIGV